MLVAKTAFHHASRDGRCQGCLRSRSRSLWAATDRMRRRMSRAKAISRRRFLAAAGTGVLALRFPFPQPYAAEPAPPNDHPLASFDREMEAFMQARGAPGGTLAVVRNRKLIYARGYGWADREKKLPAKPTS